jgi:hypothetical protein
VTTYILLDCHMQTSNPWAQVTANMDNTRLKPQPLAALKREPSSSSGSKFGGTDTESGGYDTDVDTGDESALKFSTKFSTKVAKVPLKFSTTKPEKQQQQQTLRHYNGDYNDNNSLMVHGAGKNEMLKIAEPVISGNAVSSHEPRILRWNNFDPVEEVIIGHTMNAAIPDFEPAFESRLGDMSNNFAHNPGMRSSNKCAKAQAELDGFANLLADKYGVTVHRPDVVENKATMAPSWTSARMNGWMCPRDTFLVLGNEIIESPCNWRCRYWEQFAYRDTLAKIFVTLALEWAWNLLQEFRI